MSHFRRMMSTHRISFSEKPLQLADVVIDPQEEKRHHKLFIDKTIL